jgi:hypothetical protein
MMQCYCHRSSSCSIVMFLVVLWWCRSSSIGVVVVGRSSSSSWFVVVVVVVIVVVDIILCLRYYCDDVVSSSVVLMHRRRVPLSSSLFLSLSLLLSRICVDCCVHTLSPLSIFLSSIPPQQFQYLSQALASHYRVLISISEFDDNRPDGGDDGSNET